MGCAIMIAAGCIGSLAFSHARSRPWELRAFMAIFLLATIITDINKTRHLARVGVPRFYIRSVWLGSLAMLTGVLIVFGEILYSHHQ
jgi:hypothetical protein